MSNYRIAKSLDKMREQANAHAPKRNKASDGWIGDAAHASTTSDHNPWVKDGTLGIVTALDITHDPASGIDANAIFEQMRIARDPRVKYVITHRKIFSSTNQPWASRTYTGSNPHTSHIHVSVNSGKHHYDDDREWRLFTVGAAPTPPAPVDGRQVLRRGSKGDEVKIVQAVVFSDGDFGQQTENAVKAFQRRHKLKDDGVVGPATWAAIDNVLREMGWDE